MRSQFTHWVKTDDPAAIHAVTACGLDVDGRPGGEEVAWTRSDPSEMQGQPYSSWPPACEPCLAAFKRGSYE